MTPRMELVFRVAAVRAFAILQLVPTGVTVELDFEKKDEAWVPILVVGKSDEDLLLVELSDIPLRGEHPLDEWKVFSAGREVDDVLSDYQQSTCSRPEWQTSMRLLLGSTGVIARPDKPPPPAPPAPEPVPAPPEATEEPACP